MRRLRFIVPMFLAGMMALQAGFANAQEFPGKTVRIVTSGAGGPSDIATRLVAQGITAPLGQPVIVENRAAGNAVVEAVAKAPPDGHTILLYGSALWLGPFMQKNAPYDPVRDFSPITLALTSPNILVVHPSVPARSVKELIALAKARPGQINYASAGNGSGAHLSGELFKNLTGTDLVHVPYKGGAPSVTAVISGETEIAFMSAVSALAQIKVGKLRVLALTSAKRTNALPGVPTIEEAGVAGYRVVPMFALYAPAATPKEIIALLNREIRSAVESSEVRERYASQAVDAAASTPEEVRAILVAEIAQWEKVVRQTGMRVD